MLKLAGLAAIAVAVIVAGCADSDSGGDERSASQHQADISVTGSSTDTTALDDVDSSIQLGMRLRQLGLGCRDVGPSLGSLSPSAHCTIDGVHVVLNTWPDKAGRDEFLAGKPKELCIVVAHLGEDQVAIVVGDFWTVRPDSVEVARRIASETGGRLLVADC